MLWEDFILKTLPMYWRFRKISVIRAEPRFCRSKILPPAVEVLESKTYARTTLNIKYCILYLEIIENTLKISWKNRGILPLQNPEDCTSPCKGKNPNPDCLQFTRWVCGLDPWVPLATCCDCNSTEDEWASFLTEGLTPWLIIWTNVKLWTLALQGKFDSAIC